MSFVMFLFLILLIVAVLVLIPLTGPVARAAVQHVFTHVEEAEKEFAQFVKREKQKFKTTKATALAEHVDKVFQK